jgi:thiol-disulfide isomerase/thioredoxin
MKRIYPLIFVLALIVSCKQKNERNNVKRISPLLISEIKLSNLMSEPIDLLQYKGRTVFINFWATWCKPCVAEMPSLQRMTKKLDGENIVFLFASDETGREIEEFKRTKGYTLDFVKAGNLSDLNVMGLPTTFIFDKNGELVFSEIGARQWDSVESISLITQISAGK